MDNREDAMVAQVRRPTRTWSPVLEVDGMPIAFDAMLRHYREGHAGLLDEALEQPLLLPQDMAAYRSFNHPDFFLSLKRDLAMVSYSAHFIYIYLRFIAEVSSFFFKKIFTYWVTQQVFVAEEWVKNSRNETRSTLDARDTVEAQLGALKDK